MPDPDTEKWKKQREERLVSRHLQGTRLPLSGRNVEHGQIVVIVSTAVLALLRQARGENAHAWKAGIAYKGSAAISLGSSFI